jgi:tetratricopeptide (TPR) repeat protein
MKKVVVFILFILINLLDGCNSKTPTEKELLDSGNSNIENHNYAKAISDLQQCVRINPKNTEAFNRLGIAYDYAGDYDSAMDCYQRAVNIDPDYAQAWVNLGNSYSNKGSYDDAIDCYKKAVELSPHLARVYYYIGIAYDAKGEKELGLQYIKQSARMTYEKAQQHLRNLGETW